MKYIEYYNQINADELRKGLLAYGLFCDRLPPLFTSESFYAYCEKNGFNSFGIKPYDYIRYSCMRNTNVPRLFGIPHPIAYCNLCNVIHDNWDLIRKSLEDHSKQQQYCVSQNSAVYTYVIKIISKYHLGRVALHYYLVWISQYVLLFPYLVLFIEKWVFEVFTTSEKYKKELSDKLYELGIKQNNYQACSFALYWAYKYNFDLNCDFVNDAIDSNDCIFLTLAWVKVNEINDEDGIKKLENHAQVLMSDFDQFWLFIYETLNASLLPGDLKDVKNANVSFIKRKI